jgi:hypothetical protein
MSFEDDYIFLRANPNASKYKTSRFFISLIRGSNSYNVRCSSAIMIVFGLAIIFFSLYNK